VSPDELVAAAHAWRDDDPDPGDRAELDRLVAEGDLDELRDRFGARLEFGTAGLRGAMGAGPNRMNRAVVIRATAGLAAYLGDQGHAGRPVVVGYDARHRSAQFAADVATTLAGAGFPVQLADRPLPTPVVAFGVRHLGCRAGVVVTASHNPPRDNGYKVYLGDGAQIAPPVDAEISAAIDAVGPVAAVPRAPLDDPGITRIGPHLLEAYVRAAVAMVAPGAASGVGGRARGVEVVYTPLHGVGRDVVLGVFERAGFPAPHVVLEQGEPDPDFPTVAFPNPEEPGALDLALAAARDRGADVVLANDPDADRLAVAVPDALAESGGSPGGWRVLSGSEIGVARPESGGSPGGWRALSGDEIGVVLADWLLAQGGGADRLVVTTVVSSSMLGRLAAARGVEHAETLTGFKWIARAALARPDLRFVYGYEEALGSCVGTLVRDKDGITAALAFADLVAFEKARGRTVADRLDDLARELGVHATGQRSLRFEGLDGIDRMRGAVDRLAAGPPPTLAGRPVTEVEDLRLGRRLPPTDGVLLRAGGLRLIVRPSGTEPKLKCYAEAVVPVGAGSGDRDDPALAAARAEGRAGVEKVLGEAEGALGSVV
jgi:phosphomannomutase